MTAEDKKVEKVEVQDDLKSIVERHEEMINSMDIRMQGFEAALACLVSMRIMRDTMRKVWKGLDTLISSTGKIANEDYVIRGGMIQLRNALKKTLEDTGNW